MTNEQATRLCENLHFTLYEDHNKLANEVVNTLASFGLKIVPIEKDRESDSLVVDLVKRKESQWI